MNNPSAGMVTHSETTKWHPIETAPKDVSCIFYQPSGRYWGECMVIGMIYNGYFQPDAVGGAEMECDLDLNRATHWMPLPEAPR